MPTATRRQSQRLTGTDDANTRLGQSFLSRTPENVFLFIPNLIGRRFIYVFVDKMLTHIGYARIVLAISSLYYMPIHPRTCSLLYSISCLLDAADGAAARKFEQSTRFGAVLDMVIDRCTTSCLLVFLASAFPRWSIIFQSLISLDFASHYVHMYATLAMGGGSQSHRHMDDKVPWVMKLYYTDKVRRAAESLGLADRHAEGSLYRLCYE
jgi:CDP-diacylglycerol--inositol 3-phosphatidyltransferase